MILRAWRLLSTRSVPLISWPDIVLDGHPMHAIIASVGTRGDILPAIAVGRLMRAQGYDVSLLANPAFTSLIEGSEIAFVPIGDEGRFRAMIDSADYWDHGLCL